MWPVLSLRLAAFILFCFSIFRCFFNVRSFSHVYCGYPLSVRVGVNEKEKNKANNKKKKQKKKNIVQYIQHEQTLNR